MASIGTFDLIPPNEWLFAGHGDVLDGKRRAEQYFRSHGTYDGAEYSIEEFVRQWVLRQLLESYNYPEEWIGERIVIEEPVKMGSSEKEADIEIRGQLRIWFSPSGEAVETVHFGCRRRLPEGCSSTIRARHAYFQSRLTPYASNAGSRLTSSRSSDNA